MKCIFCESDNVSLINEKSYEKIFGIHGYFFYRYLLCNDCSLEFTNDEISEFNVKSYKDFEEFAKKHLIYQINKRVSSISFSPTKKFYYSSAQKIINKNNFTENNLPTKGEWFDVGNISSHSCKTLTIA